MVQAAEILPPPSTIMKELGWNGSYLDLSYDARIDLKQTYAIDKKSIRRFLDARMLHDSIENEDAVIYLTNAIPAGYGIYSATFIFC